MTTVFLHPIGLDREFWSGVAPADAQVIELPGHGDAPVCGPITLGGMADYVVARLDGPATIVGCSLGGVVAQQIAVRAPAMVASLVVVCADSVGRPEMMAQRAEETRSAGMEGVMADTLQRWFTPAALAQADHPGVAYARRRLAADDPEVVAQYWEAMGANDVLESLPGLRMPVTFIAGAADRGCSPEVMGYAAARVPGAVLEVIDGPHMLVLERGAPFLEALARHQARAAEHRASDA